MSYIIYFSFLILLICVSCSDLDKDDQVKSVLELKKQVTNIKQEFERIKIDSVSDLKLSTYEVERRIKQN